MAMLLAVILAASPAQADPLHSDAELDQFAWVTMVGSQPWRGRHEQLLAQASKPWASGSTGGRYATTIGPSGKKTCHPDGDTSQVDYLKEGAPDVYAKALAHRATHPALRDMMLGFEARARILALTSTYGFHGPDGDDFSGDNQCVLDLAVSIPVWIASAELLEVSGVWTERDRGLFTVWLQYEVYPLVAWASRTRRNNWGAAGSLAARMIARYVAPMRPILFESEPELRVLFATTAVEEHDRLQRDRMGRGWRGDSQCPVFGIQDDGGIPDELRRGAGGCRAAYLTNDRDSAHTYQTMHVELLVMHAEVLRLEGDPSLYEATTASGARALLQSILFVIDNPNPGGRSWDWGVRTGALRVASRYYADPRLEAQVAANAHLGFRGGRIFPYTQIDLDTGP
jgi:hypothetical protein